MKRTTPSRWAKPIALLVTGSMLMPTLAGCGSNNANTGAGTTGSADVPPPGMMENQNRPAQAKTGGMTTKQKVVLLAGAAALYYIYKKRQAAKAQEGPNGKYFLSKNGRVYYRDLKTGKFQWVSPPRQPIEVPADEAQAYQGYSGYNRNQSGQGFGGYGTGQTYSDAVAAEPLN